MYFAAGKLSSKSDRWVVAVVVELIVVDNDWKVAVVVVVAVDVVDDVGGGRLKFVLMNLDKELLIILLVCKYVATKWR